ncbi:MAG: M67 family metallopeptidase [Chloroflexi bacterium]|nr:M67 family metallopeptidase [Chloroflexota bacterium]
MAHALPGIHMLHHHWQSMRSEIRVLIQEEACGFLAGIGSEVMQVLPVTNILHSPSRYRMDPREQVEAMQQIAAEGQSIVGIYHSHWTGPSGMSEFDIKEAAYLDAAYLVWSISKFEWKCRAFRIVDRHAHEIELRVEHRAT